MNISRLMTFFRSAGICLIAAAGGGALHGQDVAVTDPLGVYTVNIRGVEAGQVQSRTYLSMQALPEAILMSGVNTVTGNILGVQAGDLTGFGIPGRTSYVHVTTGTGRGFVADVAQFTAQGVECTEPMGAWVSPGDMILVRPHPILGEVFGMANRFNLAAGTAANLSDNVVVWDAGLGRERVYYFNSARSRWEEDGVVADASGAILRFPYGLYVIRRSPGALRVAIGGEISQHPILLPVKTGDNVFSPPVNLSRTIDAWFPTTSDRPLEGGMSASEADLLIFHEASRQEPTGPFYVSDRPGQTGWRKIGQDGETGTMDFLSALVVRRSGAPGYVRMEAGLTPNPLAQALPANPAEAEVPIQWSFSLTLPTGLPSLKVQLQTSHDLQSWTPYGNAVFSAGGLVTVPVTLPPGQSRAFYRLRATMN